jgi:hypothetical protein
LFGSTGIRCSVQSLGLKREGRGEETSEFSVLAGKIAEEAETWNSIDDLVATRRLSNGHTRG